MEIIARVAEERIRRAMEEGAFDNLRGEGKPLVFEDETWLAEDLRLAYRIMKNAGCLPPEIETHREVMSLRELVNTLDDEKERLKRLRELNFKILKLNMMRKRPLNLADSPEYEEKIFLKSCCKGIDDEPRSERRVIGR
ncbi:MAG TPA: DnaJ family domain-containing protein [Thermodesulfovibrionales bacterium]|nr:DnaJ family domain-containing protein [Thermodesulfovibrionales bacterium]